MINIVLIIISALILGLIDIREQKASYKFLKSIIKLICMAVIIVLVVLMENK